LRRINDDGAQKVAKRMPEDFDAKHQEQPEESQSAQGEEHWPGFHFLSDHTIGDMEKYAASFCNQHQTERQSRNRLRQ